jgi:hypothetical protein
VSSPSSAVIQLSNTLSRPNCRLTSRTLPRWVFDLRSLPRRAAHQDTGAGSRGYAARCSHRHAPRNHRASVRDRATCATSRQKRVTSAYVSITTPSISRNTAATA